MSADHVSTRLSALTEHDRRLARQSMASADAIVDAVAAIAATVRGLWRTLARTAASRR